MDHDEHQLIFSYYTLGIIPYYKAEWEQQQHQRSATTTTTTTSDAIIITLPKISNCCQYTTFGTKINKNGQRRDHDNVSDEIHTRNQELSTERVVPWVVDEWTIDDEKEASKKLGESIEQCRITDQDYKTKKFRINDVMAWNRFYQSHQSNFFKDRHYFIKEFPQEFIPYFHDNTTPTDTDTTAAEHRCLVEIGCGVGNAMLPLLGSDRFLDDSDDDVPVPSIQWTVYGFDLSSTAIDILRNDVRYQQAFKYNRTFCDVCDISIPNVLPSYVQNVANVTSLIFCLSAIHPTKHSIVMQNVVSTLQPGRGVLIFRDYGRFDLAQIKLGTQRSKLLDIDNFYRKHDGTKCYYFTIQDIEQLVQQQNGALEILELRYIRRKYINRSMQCERRRVWVQGRFRRTTHNVSTF